MDYGTADGPGARRREQLRTARLYFVCEAMPNGDDPEPLLRAALDGGVDIIQLRDKSGDTRLIDRAATTFRRLADAYSVPFIVNDDPELVERLGADGVHVGQDDMPVAEVREVVGREALVGISTHSPGQLEPAIEAGGIDYLSAGPIWETPTKEGRPATGLDFISFAARTTALPFFAIGGIDTGNVEQVLQAGARRLCVVRAIRDSDDPAATAADLRRAFASVGDEVAPGG